MSDESVRAALRSDAALVVVEAPAGCGKTHQGAEYAKALAHAENSPRLLIVTHTHAACSVFSSRTQGAGSRVEIATNDSLIASIAGAYHLGLGLPADIGTWARQRTDGYAELAVKVAALMKRYPMIAAAAARRYPVMLCDEYQDSSGDQHAVVMAIAKQGTRVRIFADPVQRIFREKVVGGGAPRYDWDALRRSAQAFEQLDFPHRWNSGCHDLGTWTLKARETLKAGGRIDLRSSLPPSVSVTFADNRAQGHLDFRLDKDQRKPIDEFEGNQSSLLVLTRHNETARAVRAMFFRRLPIWEGHTRRGLERLAGVLRDDQGDAPAIASALVTFMDAVGKGFSPSAFGNRFVEETRSGCTRAATGKPALLQELARLLLDAPDHHGAAQVLKRLRELKGQEAAFRDIAIDHQTEFWDAIRLSQFENVDAGLAELTHRRTYSRPSPPTRAISTIHKAKGLECGSVILMPCDAKTFPDKEDARCLLYVALSRATHRLQIVLSRTNPSPLFKT